MRTVTGWGNCGWRVICLCWGWGRERDGYDVGMGYDAEAVAQGDGGTDRAVTKEGRDVCRRRGMSNGAREGSLGAPT